MVIFHSYVNDDELPNILESHSKIHGSSHQAVYYPETQVKGYHSQYTETQISIY